VGQDHNTRLTFGGLAGMHSKHAKSSATSTDPSIPPFPDPIPGIIPFGSLCLFSGASGVGKTILKAQWCAALLRGDPILGIPTNPPSSIGYLAADRPWFPTYASAFSTAGVPDITRYCLMDPGSGYDPRALRAGNHSAFDFFDQCLNTLDPAPGSLVFVDPFAPLFIHGDQNNARNVAISLQWIRRCSQVRQLTLVCDANVAKLKADEDFKRPQDRISGSGAFLAYADTIFNFSEDAKLNGAAASTRTLMWQPRTGPFGEQTFNFDPVTRMFTPYTGLLDEGTTEDNDRPTQVLALFPPEPEDIEFGGLFDLAHEAFNISKATLKRDLTVLITRGLVSKDGWGAYTRRKLA
jgi:hypothetical protein